MKAGEHQIQCALMQWWRQASPKEIRPLLFAIPNGGARHAATGAMLKREGVRAGIPDLFLAIGRGGYHGLFLELKTEKGRLSTQQRAMLCHLTAAGYFCVTAYGLDHAIDAIKGYLALPETRKGIV